MGQFLMDDGMGTSIPTFFKFEPAGNAPAVCRDVGILAQKLGHVKVFTTSHARHRSLIVTQSATNRGVPVSLNEYLHRSSTEVAPNISQLVGQVVAQLTQLGGESEDEFLLGSFLWEHLERGAIEKVWNNCDLHRAFEDETATPLATSDFLKASRSKHWATRRNCVHGDLNATNVAIDATQPESPQAYIFDAAGMRADFEYRDLATLEVTTILFNSVGVDEQAVLACRPFYGQDFLPTTIPDAASGSAFTQNLFGLISTIRSRFQTVHQRKVYALLVFDAALRQLFGLGIQPSPNKVRNPLHACYLAAWAAKWLQSVARDIFTDGLRE
jgi:hypothetical protein